MSDQRKLKANEVKGLAECTNTSSRIRYLNSVGWTTSEIHKHLGKLYQHVRNVLITPVKNPVK